MLCFKKMKQIDLLFILIKGLGVCREAPVGKHKGGTTGRTTKCASVVPGKVTPASGVTSLHDTKELVPGLDFIIFLQVDYSKIMEEIISKNLIFFPKIVESMRLIRILNTGVQYI